MKNQVLFLCHYLVAMCACIPQTSKNLSPKRYGQLKTLLLIMSCYGWGLHGAADRGTAALVNHTVRVK